MKKLDRRTVLLTGGLAVGHASLAPARGAEALPLTVDGDGGGTNESPDCPTSTLEQTMTNEVRASFPSTDPEDASAVVGAAHTDIDTVTELVTARPHLARASVDWGFGDWESAIGAASHMGRRDIAELLLAHDARPTIFSAAMMGQLDVVRAMVEAAPGVQRIPGPHGITLLAHARAGGDAAAAVYEYLEGLGDADEHPEIVDLSESERRAFVGDYTFEAAEHPSLEISEQRGALWLRRDGTPFGRRLFAVSEREFYPAGSPTVRIAFEVDDNGARLRIVDDVLVLEATRAR